MTRTWSEYVASVSSITEPSASGIKKWFWHNPTLHETKQKECNLIFRKNFQMFIINLSFKHKRNFHNWIQMCAISTTGYKYRSATEIHIEAPTFHWKTCQGSKEQHFPRMQKKDNKVPNYNTKQDKLKGHHSTINGFIHRRMVATRRTVLWWFSPWGTLIVTGKKSGRGLK